MQLYGFADRAERELFVQMLTVNGIGPKVALAIVSGSPAEDLRRAIVREDTARFMAIPGIGKKTAERIVLELKEKMSAAVELAATGSATLDSKRATRSSSSAIRSSDAEQALRDIDPDLSPEDRVRLALKRAA